jgi:iron complex outermembrane receptor protein
MISKSQMLFRMVGSALLVQTSLISQAVYAQQAGEVKLQRTEITGSAIKRSQVEGPAPVQTINRKEIESTGASSVNELLKSITSVDIFDQGELASNSPAASGTANVTLRGLDETSVLVLLNGKRLPTAALYDASGAGSAVDINQIPLGAIERIEILKDGGSAIYGADAVAGVFNIITRKDFNGYEAKVGYGMSSEGDAKEKRFALSGGWGNLDEDRWNTLLTIDFFKRDPLYRKDRDISKTSDFRSKGGSDGRSSFSPYGNNLDAAGENFDGTQQKPCPAESLNGTRCRYDFNASLLTAYNGADRLTMLSNSRFKVSDTLGISAILMYARNEDYFEAHPVPDYFLAPAGNYYAGRFMQGGPRISDRTSDLIFSNFGLDGVVGGYDWSASLGYGVVKTTLSDSNYYNADLWNEATSNGSIDATSSNNNPALVESLKVSPVRKGKSELTTIDTKVSGELMALESGSLAFAAGINLWHESIDDTPDKLTQEGKVVGSIQQSAVTSSRSAKAVFGELSVPITKQLEMQAALRVDSYPDESATSPKLAFAYRPMQELLLRASYASSFKAPRLKQLYGAKEEGAITLNTAEECAVFGLAEECAKPAYQVNGSNSNLSAEKGKTFNIGLVADFKPFTFGIDWWSINLTDSIDTPTIAQALRAGKYYVANGRTYVETTLDNIAETKTSGIDFDAGYTMPVFDGKLSIKNTMTRNLKNEALEGGEWFDYLGVYGTTPTPKYRNRLSFGYEDKIWTGNLIMNYTTSFKDYGEGFNSNNPIPVNTRTVDSHTEWSITAAYRLDKNLVLNFGILNLFDEEPPFSNVNATSNNNTQMGFPELYSSRGRFFYVNSSFKF